MAKRPPPSALPEKGNRRAVTHGAYARIAADRLQAKEQEVYDALAADAPVRGPGGGLPAADGAAVALLAQTLCRLETVGEWIEEHGEVQHRRYTSDDPKVKRRRNRKQRQRRSVDPMRVVAMEEKLTGRAHDLLDALGMTPRSRAKLGVDMARTADLATAMSEPDPERRAELLRDAGVIEGEAEDA